MGLFVENTYIDAMRFPSSAIGVVENSKLTINSENISELSFRVRHVK
jgi:hypothetical protein